jgi:hypothetical protein
MRKTTRDEAIKLGLRPETWDQVQSLPRRHFRRVALTRAVGILRRVHALEKKYGPIRIR